AQILVAAFADPQQLRLAAGGELPRDQTEPGGEITAAVEALRMTDGGHKRRRDDRAEARNRYQPTGLIVLFRPSDELGVEGCNPAVNLGPLRPGVGDEQDHAWAQPRSALLVHQKGQERRNPPAAAALLAAGGARRV